MWCVCVGNNTSFLAISSEFLLICGWKVHWRAGSGCFFALFDWLRVLLCASSSLFNSRSILGANVHFSYGDDQRTGENLFLLLLLELLDLVLVGLLVLVKSLHEVAVVLLLFLRQLP